MEIGGIQTKASAGPGASTHVDESGACQLDPGGPRVGAYYSSLPSKRITLSKKLMEAERVHAKETCLTAFVGVFFFGASLESSAFLF